MSFIQCENREETITVLEYRAGLIWWDGEKGGRYKSFCTDHFQLRQAQVCTPWEFWGITRYNESLEHLSGWVFAHLKSRVPLDLQTLCQPRCLLWAMSFLCFIASLLSFKLQWRAHFFQDNFSNIQWPPNPNMILPPLDYSTTYHLCNHCSSYFYRWDVCLCCFPY